MQPALNLVVNCFPPVHVGSPALAILGERELLLALLRRQLRMEDDAFETQCSTALVTQLAVAVVSYCSDQLQPQVQHLRVIAAHAYKPSETVGRARQHKQSRALLQTGYSFLHKESEVGVGCGVHHVGRCCGRIGSQAHRSCWCA